jgi:uncharacterized protein YqjF (DUF2071 family)
MNELETHALATLAALAARVGPIDANELASVLGRSGIAKPDVAAGIALVTKRGLASDARDGLSITHAGLDALLEGLAAIELALGEPTVELCPSVPWLTTVQSEWIEAVSINYAVDPDALAPLLPAPLQPELWKGSAWVQLLVSSLRGMRPQGLGALGAALGVDFYQASYRAAVRWQDKTGAWRRGGYFVRTETNDPLMRAVGNRLREFSFHDFGLAAMAVVRSGVELVVAIDPSVKGGQVVATFDTSERHRVPSTSCWRDLDDMFEPLVECYDAFGVADGHVYVLTIDRGPWNARFAEPRELWAEYFVDGPLGHGASRLDSVLHVPRCPYRWRPLTREPLP